MVVGYEDPARDFAQFDDVPEAGRRSALSACFHSRRRLAIPTARRLARAECVHAGQFHLG